jgi:Tfp pilus assembly PilM family ATPase
MPRLLALEWTDTEARLAVANKRGGQVVFEHAFSVDLRPSQPGPDQPEVNVGQRLAAALAARGLGRMDALVAIGRTNIELRQLSFPPVPDEDLPEMVRFQALREFNALEESWPLDFVPIGDDPTQPRNVLAAAIDPAQVSQIDQTCQAAGLQPRRLLLRPCAAASLLRRGRPSSQVRLLVDLFASEADLAVLIDRTVVFMRCARLPNDPVAAPEAVPALLSEIRRTMAAAQNQLGGRKVETIVLCGHGNQHGALAATIQEELNTPAEVFDVFADLKLDGDLRRAMPEQPERFAPLLGALLDELEGTGHAIDFLHPRRRPEPPSRQNQYVLAGSAVLLLVLLTVGLGWYRKSALQEEVKRLQAEAATLKRQVAQATKVERLAGKISDWASPEVVWLDELLWLSEKFPPAQEGMLTQLQCMSRGGGEIHVKGLAKDVSTVKEMEDRLRDAAHRVQSRDKSVDTSQKMYTYNFSSTIVLGEEKR